MYRRRGVSTIMTHYRKHMEYKAYIGSTEFASFPKESGSCRDSEGNS